MRPPDSVPDDDESGTCLGKSGVPVECHVGADVVDDAVGSEELALRGEEGGDAVSARRGDSPAMVFKSLTGLVCLTRRFGEGVSLRGETGGVLSFRRFAIPVDMSPGPSVPSIDRFLPRFSVTARCTLALFRPDGERGALSEPSSSPELFKRFSFRLSIAAFGAFTGESPSCGDGLAGLGGLVGDDTF